MIERTVLGRYQIVDPSSNTNKFWHIIFDNAAGVYLCTWGRIGNCSPPPKEYTESQAATKIRQKIKKGYTKVNGSKEIMIENSIHFITEMCAG